MRKIWTKPRVNTFWEETCQRWNDKDWKEDFRMSREAFEYLCEELSPLIPKRDTNYRLGYSRIRIYSGISKFFVSQMNDHS